MKKEEITYTNYLIKDLNKKIYNAEKQIIEKKKEIKLLTEIIERSESQIVEMHYIVKKLYEIIN